MSDVLNLNEHQNLRETIFDQNRNFSKESGQKIQKRSRIENNIESNISLILPYQTKSNKIDLLKF